MLRRKWKSLSFMILFSMMLVFVISAQAADSDKVVTYIATEDAYVDNENNVNSNILKISPNQKVTYLKFEIAELDGFVSSAKLLLRVVQQGGDSDMEVYLAESNDWSEATIDGSNTPIQGTLVGTFNQQARPGSTIQVDLDTSIIRENGTYSLIIKSTNDNLSFTSNIGSAKAKHQPRITIETSDLPVCDQMIPSNSQVLFFGDATGLNVKPGDVVCIEAGKRPAALNLKEFHGTKERPITFINYGGQVNIEGSEMNWWAVTIGKSSHFRFTGTGDPNYMYGFNLSIRNNAGSIFEASQMATNYELDHISIIEDKIGYSGFSLHTSPSCDLSTNRGSFTQYDTKVHDNYIENTRGEGIYLGYSNYEKGVGKTCGGNRVTLWPHQLNGVRVYNNIVKDTGRDGIQIGSATEDVEVYNNVIENFATNVNAGHTAGIQINPGTTGKFYNNYIDSGISRLGQKGFENQGRGDIRIFNNVIINPSIYGILTMDRKNLNDPVFDKSPMHYWNNTIINPGTRGIDFRNAYVQGNTIRNNVIVHENEDGITKKYYTLNSGVDMTLSNNYFTKNIGDPNFVHASIKNYHLQSTSPLIDVGYDLASEGVNFDYDYITRPAGALDIGAFEYPAP